MTRTKKILMIIGASLLTLLVISNTFFIYLLVTTYRNDKNATDPFYEWNEKRQILLRYNPDSLVDSEQQSMLVLEALKDDPSILCDEPIIFIANPDLKPLVAKILEEEPSILENNPLTLYKYPELIELNPKLKPILDDILERTDNPYITSLFTQ